MNRLKTMSIKLLTILWSALLLVSCGKGQPPHSNAEDALDYDGIYAAQSVQPAPESDPEKKKKYMQEDLENRLQDTIRLMSEDIEPTIRIENLFAENHEETTADVTLSIKQGYEIPEEHLKAIEKMVAGSIDEIPPENVSITIKNTEE